MAIALTWQIIIVYTWLRAGRDRYRQLGGARDGKLTPNSLRRDRLDSLAIDLQTYHAPACSLQ